MAINLNQSTRAYNLPGSVKITTGATSAVTANAVGVSEILVVATAALWFTMDTAPTAAASTAGNIFMAAGEKFHLQVNPGFKVAAIQDSAAGALYVIPVA